jgi:cation diffusion facilitator CzcD-associated flavoprotein CzcO
MWRSFAHLREFFPDSFTVVHQDWQRWEAFPFDPNPEWSHFYSSGGEIQEYIVRTTKKWNLDRDIQLNTRVVEAVWQHDKGQWKVTIEKNGKREAVFAHVLINGQGPLE